MKLPRHSKLNRENNSCRRNRCRIRGLTAAKTPNLLTFPDKKLLLFDAQLIHFPEGHGRSRMTICTSQSKWLFLAQTKFG